jgi:GMP synthase (glutamine-hydrolysing)
MSHGDSVTRVPTGFEILAKSYVGTTAAMRRGNIWGVQFHPEVTHTPFGKVILQNFMEASLCKKDWFPPTLVTSLQDDIRASVGTRRAIAGFSGGVDSTVMTALAGPVLGKNFRAVLIDGGQLREGEREQAAVHARIAGVELKTIDAANIFVPAISREIDAEAKRRIFKQLYTDCLIKAASDFDAEVVFQGTLAPDRIESGSTGGVIIKSHHNVGLNMGNLQKAHPLQSLFKYEVRALAKEMGLPESVWKRHPFPGPGLFTRVVGVPVSYDTLALVRWADARVREVLKRHDMHEQLSQVVVGYIGANTVGVAGDGRVYGGAVVVRAVETTDFMTAHGVWLPSEVVTDIKKVFSQYHGIVRVWFDPTDKPPATIEFE